MFLGVDILKKKTTNLSSFNQSDNKNLSWKYEHFSPHQVNFDFHSAFTNKVNQAREPINSLVTVLEAVLGNKDVFEVFTVEKTCLMKYIYLILSLTTLVRKSSKLKTQKMMKI